MADNAPPRAAAPSGQAPSATLRAELHDAVTPRAAVLVIGVLLLQLGFIASYLGAFHAPKPRHIDIAVVAPAGAPAGTARSVADRLNAIASRPLQAREAPDAGAATQLIRDRKAYGAFVIGASGRDQLLVASSAGGAVSEALSIIFDRVEATQQRTIAVDDVLPASVGDSRGLSGFYLAVGWVVGGYLCSAILAIGGGARPANRRRAGIRLGALALYAVASGFGGALIAESVLTALSGHFLALWGLGALLVFAVGAFTAGVQVLLGTVGIGVAILLFVVLGNPSAGGAYPPPLLPPFWAAIGPWLPPGAGTDAARGIVYFGGTGITQDLLVLLAYLVVGVALTVAASRRQVEVRTTDPQPAAA